MKKRSAKKNNSKKAPKYGRNVYGDRCIVKEVEIQKETAFEQCAAIVDDIDTHNRRGLTLEYTVFYSKELTNEEIRVINQRLSFLMEIRSRIRNKAFVEAEFCLSSSKEKAS